MRRTNSTSYEVSIAGDMAEVRAIGNSMPARGRILGSVQTGSETHYFVDRLLLPAGPTDIDDVWRAEGAISTILIQTSARP